MNLPPTGKGQFLAWERTSDSAPFVVPSKQLAREREVSLVVGAAVGEMVIDTVVGAAAASCQSNNHKTKSTSYFDTTNILRHCD